MGFLLFYILGPALVGGLLLLAGKRLRLGNQKMNAWQESQVRLLLTEWRIVIAQEKETQVTNVLYDCLTILLASTLIAVGAAMLLFASVMICLALRVFGTLLIPLSPRVQPLVELLYATFVLGSGAGFLSALKQIRRRAQQGIRYGDLRQRQVADYRSLFLQALPLLCLLLIGSVTVIFAPYIGSSTRLEFMGAVFALPGWTIWIIPMLLVTVTVMAEIHIARVVRFPRLLVTLDPELARGFDDLLRAMLVGWLLCCEFLAIGMLSWAQYGLVNMNISSLHHGVPGIISMLLVLSYICGFLMIFAGVLVSSRRGRLGGKISQQFQQVKLESV